MKGEEKSKKIFTSPLFSRKQNTSHDSIIQIVFSLWNSIYIFFFSIVETIDPLRKSLN